MKKLAIGLGLILVLIISGCQAKFASQPTTSVPSETQPAGSWEIDKGLQYGQEAISGDLLVGYKFDFTGANIDQGKFPSQTITVYNLKTKKQERTIEVPAGRMIDTPSIYGNKIVFDAVEANGFFSNDVVSSKIEPAPNYDIFLFDMGTNQMRQLTNEEHAQISPRIYGDTVVWLDARNQPLDQYPPPFDVYALDLKTNTERRLTANPTAEGYTTLAISGDWVVWTDMRHADPSVTNHANDDYKYNNEIYAYNLATNEERRITNSPTNDYCPDIDGNHIVWSRQEDYQKADVFMYDLDNGQETQISHSGYVESGPSIYGDKIVWTDAGSSQGNTANDVVANGQQPGSAIVLFDLKTQKETLLTPVEADKVWLWPSIYGNHVVFVWDRQTGGVAYALDLP